MLDSSYKMQLVAVYTVTEHHCLSGFCSGVSQSVLASGVHCAWQGQQQMLRQNHLQ